MFTEGQSSPEGFWKGVAHVLELAEDLALLMPVLGGGA